MPALFSCHIIRISFFEISRSLVSNMIKHIVNVARWTYTPVTHIGSLLHSAVAARVSSAQLQRFLSQQMNITLRDYLCELECALDV
ncbi:hypothetical protein EON64_14920, partial [archaeon]